MIVVSLTAVTVGGGLLSFWYSFQTNSFFDVVVNENLAALQAADGLETSLVMQKGYLTYFFQDGDEGWLKDLEARHRGFLEWLAKARQWADTPEDQAVLGEVEAEYAKLKALRDRVVLLYKDGQAEKGYQLHQEARLLFFKILSLAQEFRRGHEDRIEAAQKIISRRARMMSGLALAATPLTLFLSGFLAFMLLRQVLGPIRVLADQASSPHNRSGDVDEVKALRHGLANLIEDADHTKSELQSSRMQLMQAAKMASVGKLAASVAHSIRNPLTAVKMRLFSLERSLSLSEVQRDDFKVISDEIRHIDTIVRNFLEFSRRPKLNMQAVSASAVVDAALELVRPRMESYWIQLALERQDRLPVINADVDQLKEALVNLLFNSSEAVAEDGRITVAESQDPDSPLGPAVLIRIMDNGPGVPESLQGQIFQPFFSTKDEGTGLGLSIASRIVEEHGGLLDYVTPQAGGACFIITLPIREGSVWTRS